jgi:hypothetical protein
MLELAYLDPSLAGGCVEHSHVSVPAFLDECKARPQLSKDPLIHARPQWICRETESARLCNGSPSLVAELPPEQVAPTRVDDIKELRD